MMFTLPWPPKELSPNARLHWSALARAKKAYREACHITARQQGACKLKADRIHVAFTFYPPNRARRDLDGCISRMKAGIDGLADVLGVDDSKWSMGFVLAEEIGGFVRVEVVA
jgi:crossover junction endodeoxyribonuclease RusA